MGLLATGSESVAIALTLWFAAQVFPFHYEPAVVFFSRGIGYPTIFESMRANLQQG